MKMKRQLVNIALTGLLVLGSSAVASSESLRQQVSIDGRTFEAVLFQSSTLEGILQMGPLQLKMQHYADHEFYASLPAKPVMAAHTTSQIKGGHLYYWDGWNALVINYRDTDITPYQVVHIGEFTDPSSLVEYLSDKETISVSLPGPR